MHAYDAKPAFRPKTREEAPGEVARQDARGPVSLNPQETGQYLSDMILELRNMAKAAKLYKVMVPLEFAYYEAFSAANKVDIPPDEMQRLAELSRVAKAYAPEGVE
jgi:hypothetical protein